MPLGMEARRRAGAGRGFSGLVATSTLDNLGLLMEDCVRRPIFPASTGQRPTFYILILILRELTLFIKRILAFSSHRLSFRRLFTQSGEWLVVDVISWARR